MRIEKYLTNKDITLTNDDIDVQKLITDLQKGMVSENEVEERLNKARDEAIKEATSRYSELESKYNDLEKRNADLTTSNASLKLENVMTRAGFQQEQFKEVSTLRNTLFGEEKDDEKAIGEIKEKYKATYFPEAEKKIVETPIEPPLKDGNNQKVEPAPVITRNTRISDLFINKK